MIYGYLRVSSDEQDINSQRQGVDQYAKENNLAIDKYIKDEGVSGGKNPDKRNLGPLLDIVEKGDVIIASEISRLGRDLYMVMDILHFCMEKGCVIHTVKDKFILGDDIQSKVLAFAFGLSAEIERQMIRQRTKEGLKLRMKMGVLLGRPNRNCTEFSSTVLKGKKNEVLQQYNYGVPIRRLAANFGVDRNTMSKFLYECGIGSDQAWYVQAKKKRQTDTKRNRLLQYKDEPFKCVDIDRDKMRELIEDDNTIPQIADKLGIYTYEQVYDTILLDIEWNALYRQHGQKKVKKVRY